MPSIANTLCATFAFQAVLVISSVVRKHVDYEGNVASFISFEERHQPMISSRVTSVLSEFQEMIRTGTAPDKEKIKIIKDIVVEQLLPDLQATHKSAKAQVDINLDAIETCNVNSRKRLEAIKGNTEKSVDEERKDHADCRAVHKTKHAHRSAACKELDDFLDSIQPPARMPEPRDRGAMVTYVESMSDYFCGKDDRCTDLDKACNEATTVHDTHKGKCDLKQRVFEGGYCTWRTELVDDCKDLATCHNGALKAYVTHVNNTVPLVKKWKITYAALKKIECYIDVWLSDGNTETTDEKQLEKCDSTPIDTTPMDMDFGAPEDMIECPMDKVSAAALSSYPGKQSWADREYGNFNELVTDIIAC